MRVGLQMLRRTRESIQLLFRGWYEQLTFWIGIADEAIRSGRARKFETGDALIDDLKSDQGMQLREMIGRAERELDEGRGVPWDDIRPN